MSSLTYLQHQTQFFVLDNALSPDEEFDGSETSSTLFRIALTKFEATLTFAIIGSYTILSNSNGKYPYILNVGRVFEFGYYDSEDKPIKLIEEHFMLFHNHFKSIFSKSVIGSKAEKFNFPIIDLEAFQANLHLHFLKID